jgi:RNA polymerase sigma-70 factor (ECF subfamily)
VQLVDSFPTNFPFCTSEENASTLAPSSLLRGPADSELDQESDVRLVELFKADRKEAMNVLYNRYRDLVLGISSRILRDKSEGEDLVQDVFLELCRRVELYDAARGSVRTWILRYTYTRCYDRRKYLNIRRGGNGSNGNGVYTSWEGEPDRSPRISDWIILKERAELVYRALDALPPKQQQIIRLICLEGMLVEEVASLMRETVTNVRQHYYRGLRKVREELNGA